MVVPSGNTVIEIPVATAVPDPQPFSYHFQIAPVASEPDAVTTELWDGKIVSGNATTPVGLLGIWVTDIIVLKQVVVLHVPSALR